MSLARYGNTQRPVFTEHWRTTRNCAGTAKSLRYILIGKRGLHKNMGSQSRHSTSSVGAVTQRICVSRGLTLTSMVDPSPDSSAWHSKAFKDWRVWTFCFAQFGSDTMLYGYSTFLPTIIRSINTTASSEMIQVLTIPCYALGAVTYLVVAHFSDRQQKRALYSLLLGIISIVGYAMLISPANSKVHYAGCFLVAMGLYVCVGLPLAWLPTNLPRYGKRTTATGMQLTIGNCAGIMSAFVSLFFIP